MDSQSFVSDTEYVKKKISFIQVQRKREVFYFEAVVSACFTDTFREIP